MPQRALKVCMYPGCNQLTREAYCAEHAKMKRQESERNTNREAKPLYNSVRWQRLRHSHLFRNPLCVECMKEKQLTAATVVDHMIPHKGNPELFFDPDNLQSLCKRHHDMKTVGEGSFGRPVKG